MTEFLCKCPDTDTCGHADPTREQMLERIAELERMQRCVQLYGYGYLLKHGSKQIDLDPKDVTVVLPSTRHMDDFDLHNSLHLAERQVQVLQDRIAKAVSLLNQVIKWNDSEAVTRHATEVRTLLLDREGEKAPGGIVTESIVVGESGCSLYNYDLPSLAKPVGEVTIHVGDPALREVIGKIRDRDSTEDAAYDKESTDA